MPLDKKAIIQELRGLKLPRNQYCVLMGAALVLHGLKNHTSDLDLGCTAGLFETLIDEGHVLIPSSSSHEKTKLSDHVHMYKEWFADNIVFIEGIPTADVASIMRDKLRIGRQKDMDDIAMIKRALDSR